jgi:DNA polymerase III epsilon subunit-like protein
MNKKTIWTKDMEKILSGLKETKLNAEEISMIMNIPTLNVEKQLNKSNLEIDFTSIIENIKGKKVLIIDLETTGLIKDRNNFYKYWDNKIYDECRIVEIGYWYSDSFDPNIESLNIHNYLRKPTDFFEIPQNVVDIHGITFEDAFNNGFTLNQIMTKHSEHNNLSFYDMLNSCDVFISHNTTFDFYVLLNELCRIKQFGTINKLLQVNKNKNVICTLKHSGYKRLIHIYKSIFKCDPTISHRAGDDVKTLLEVILKKSFNDKVNFIQKFCD